ncbi:MAG: hypothetical protein ACYTGL_10830 [Planctomycetota bacterium]|jgi:hypothetical protein
MSSDRLISGIIALGWIIAFVLLNAPPWDPSDPVKTLGLPAVALIPLALIWFGDELGEFTGMTGRGYVSEQTPGWMVKGFGWIVLFALIGCWLYDLTS